MKDLCLIVQCQAQNTSLNIDLNVSTNEGKHFD